MTLTFCVVDILMNIWLLLTIVGKEHMINIALPKMKFLKKKKTNIKENFSFLPINRTGN